MSSYIQIFIKEYKRKDGTFVKSHMRTIKQPKKNILIRIGNSTNPNQLILNFTGNTKNIT